MNWLKLTLGIYRVRCSRSAAPVARIVWRGLLLGLLGLLPQAVWSDTHSTKLKHVKAAFVLNIAKFVTWPEQIYQQRPHKLVLCHYRDDFLGPGFDSIRHRRVEGRELQVDARQDLDSSDSCDILLVPEQHLGSLAEEAALGMHLPLLTIADLTDVDRTGVSHAGVLLALVRDGARMGFEVNLSAVERSGLQLSSQLLKLARIVRDVSTTIEAVSTEESGG